MTVTGATSRTTYLLNGATLGPFSTVWPYEQDSDVNVYLDEGSGPILLGAGVYSLTDAGAGTLEAGGSVTLSNTLLVAGAWPPGSKLVLVRAVSADQPSAFGQMTGFSPQSSEEALDHVARQIQDVATAQLSAMTAPIGDATDMTLPTPEARASMFAAYDGTGKPIASPGAISTIAASMFMAAFIALGTPLEARAQLGLGAGTSIGDYGAPTGVADHAAFADAIAALPASGGEIVVPNGAYVIDAAPNIGSRSILWKIDPGATFSGAASDVWPRLFTNPSMAPVGYWMISQSLEPEPTTPFMGALSAWSVEVIQPAGNTGQYVAGFLGADSASANAAARLWAGNFLMQLRDGFTGNGITLEIDLNNEARAGAGQAITVNGTGTYSPEAAYVVNWGSTDATAWQYGLLVNNALLGIQINGNGGTASSFALSATNCEIGAYFAAAGLIRGVVVGGVVQAGTSVLAGMQLANGDDSILIQRATDVAPTGSLIRLADHANDTTLFRVDVLGNVSMNEVGFNGTAPGAKQTVNGSKAGNAALASLMGVLSATGLLTDATT